MSQYIIHTQEIEYLTFRIDAANEHEAVKIALGKSALSYVEPASISPIYRRQREIMQVIPVEVSQA